MTAKSKLSPDEAQEYSSSLGKAATGNYELMDFAIHTLRVPEALGMDAGQWVESIGGYVRMSIENRQEAVRQLSGEKRGEGTQTRYEKSEGEVARILGISETTVKNDRAIIEARVALETSPKELPEGDATLEDLLDAGFTNTEIAAKLGVSVRTAERARKEWEKDVEEAATAAPSHPTRSTGSGTTSRKPSKKERENEALTQLDGYLARIEGDALNFAAWWRQEGQKDLANQLAWVDETVSHTEEKISMILKSVRGVNSDADAALTEWLAEEERRSG